MNKRTNRTEPLRRYIKYISLVCVFGVLPIVMYWAYNLGQVKPAVVLKPMLLIVLAVVALFLMFQVILRSLKKTTLLMLLVIFLFFTYGHLVQTIPERSLFTGFHLLIIYGFLFLSGTILILRSETVSDNLFNFFQIVVVLLLVFNLIKIIRYDPRITKNVDEVSINPPENLNVNELPDIYYIVLDAYSREDVLQNEFGFDNSEFLQSLEERGFFIPKCALSNYEETPQVIPSVLNFDYLDNLGISNDLLGHLTSANTNLVLNSRIRQIFTDLGYQFVTTRGWAPFNDISDSDNYLNYYYSQGLPDKLEEKAFSHAFWSTTLAHAVSEFPLLQASEKQCSNSTSGTGNANGINLPLEYERAEFWYHQTNYTFDSLMNLQENEGPYLVYAHFNTPHGPYVFNRNESFRFTTDLSNEKSLYVDMLPYTNKRTLELIDALIENSDTPPIIIIQADHGSHILDKGIEKHKILSAYYLPGKIDIEPYDTITPVNNFRLVLHDYFDPTVELLPDELYVFKDGTFAEMPSSCSLP